MSTHARILYIIQQKAGGSGQAMSGLPTLKPNFSFLFQRPEGPLVVCSPIPSPCELKLPGCVKLEVCWVICHIECGRGMTFRAGLDADGLKLSFFNPQETEPPSSKQKGQRVGSSHLFVFLPLFPSNPWVTVSLKVVVAIAFVCLSPNKTQEQVYKQINQIYKPN